MEVSMSSDEVLNQIKQLQTGGGDLSKKKVKQAHPDLMRSALFYFPSWEQAILNANALG
ncbi:hypothetical protein PP175_04385 [Aneurinibacillus sp. Ricciae_BoGa-3]|uniref:hypothetical protein n=1 Tax=Aneurinibacillus sp. Ricciae_BoGa-3 TaxID=3022697 RepID=UPI0023413DF3|nr:hypothetical protein [Aneurinibacillus sp. Ricciae_BoGa-3]WCK55231.1 hypothetical protein PP175_04385 [Aneurinibacillus sp. Ricciae_BoGa-3]